MKFRDYSFGSTILGKGISSVVYKAKKEKSKKTYAIKCISEEFLKNQYTKSLLSNQIQALKSLRHHENIIQLFQFGSFQNNYYIVTQLCQKGSLADKLQNGKKISEAQAVYIIKELIKAYKSLYSNHYIHRDIKPGNILIKQNNEIRLCDFGLSVNTLKPLIYQNQTAGTNFYMAPESIKYKKYSYKSDFWAIGVTFYRMLTGQVPIKQHFKSQSQLNKMIQESLKHQILEEINFYSKQFLKLTLVANPGDRISSKTLFDFNFQRINKSLYFSNQNFKKQGLEYIKQKDQTKLTQVTKDSQNQRNKSQVNDFSVKQKKLKSDIFKSKKQNLDLNAKVRQRRLSKTQIGKLQDSINNQNVKSQTKKLDSKMQHILKENIANQNIKKTVNRKKDIQKCKIIEALLSQINLVRFINRMIYRVQKKLPAQGNLIISLQCFVIAKLEQLKNLQNLSQKDVNCFKLQDSYKKWVAIIQQYILKLKNCHNELNNQQKRLKAENSIEYISETIKKYYFSLNFQNKQKDFSQILVTIDFLITLKLLLEMQNSKNYEHFYFESSINQILELKFPREVNQEHIEQITKKLMNINFF